MALKTGLTIGAKMTWLGNIWWLVRPGRASKVLPAESTCHSVWPAAACIAGMHWQRHTELGQDSSGQERVGIVCRREWTARKSLSKSSPEARTQLWLGGGPFWTSRFSRSTLLPSSCPVGPTGTTVLAQICQGWGREGRWLEERRKNLKSEFSYKEGS